MRLRAGSPRRALIFMVPTSDVRCIDPVFRIPDTEWQQYHALFTHLHGLVTTLDKNLTNYAVCMEEGVIREVMFPVSYSVTSILFCNVSPLELNLVPSRSLRSLWFSNSMRKWPETPLMLAWDPRGCSTW